MPFSKLNPLTRTSSRYLRNILSFVVTFGAGLAPLWGGKVPGFHAILDVYPKDLRDVIPWASFAMSATAVAVQFFEGDFMKPRRLKKTFVVIFVTFIVLLLASYIAYKAVVIRIQVPGSHGSVAYVVGSKPLPTCECAKRGLEIRECIGFAITVNPDDVNACFSQQEISRRSTLLSVLYILLLLSLGFLIGLLILKNPTKTQPADSAQAAGLRA